MPIPSLERDGTLEEGRRDEAIGQIHDVDDGRHMVAVDFPHEILDGYRTDWGKGCWDDWLEPAAAAAPTRAVGGVMAGSVSFKDSYYGKSQR